MRKSGVEKRENEMKIILAIAVALATITGCRQAPIQVPSETGGATKAVAREKDLRDADKVAILRQEAKIRHLRWMVYCIPKTAGYDGGFQASAEHDDVPVGTIYIEDGAKDFWIARGPTAADAAYELSKIIHDPPSHHPMNKPGSDGDCNYQTVLDSAHTAELPCKAVTK